MHGLAMLPFYIYYSMFGFQRVDDQIWAAADQRPRGFLLGATSSRTTRGGEGLQHQEGTSHLVAAAIPNCKAYDPGFAGEMAVIVDAGMREMLIEQRDVFYYVTLMNENYAQPSLPADVHGEVLRGCYRYDGWKNDAVKSCVQKLTLLRSGAILTEVVKAARQLAAEGFDAEVFSVTSWSELARDGQGCEAGALRGEDAALLFIARQLARSFSPIITATDYVRAVPESVRTFLLAGRRYLTLGTDGFGRSDTRAELRKFFGVDAATVVRVAKVTVGNGA